jgi:hypothetical protein
VCAVVLWWWWGCVHVCVVVVGVVVGGGWGGGGSLDAGSAQLGSSFRPCPLVPRAALHGLPRMCGAQVIVAERGPLVWVFNFSPFNTYEGLQVGRCACRPIVLVRSAAPTRALPPQLLPAAALPFSARGGSHTPTPAPPLPPFPRQIPVPEPGKYRVALDSDAWDFGGPGRVGHDVDHFTVVRLPHLGGRRACQPPTPRVCQLCYRERRGCSRCISSGRGPACSCHP